MFLVKTEEAMATTAAGDRIARVEVSSCYLPLANPVSDAKVLIEIRHGRMRVPTRPGLGLTLTGQARRWTREAATFGDRH